MSSKDAVLSTSTSGAKLATSTTPSKSVQSAHMTTTTLKVEGMTCGACTSSVEAAFRDVEGVGSVSVSLVMERAVVVHDADRVSADQIKEMIEDRGFDAEVLSSDLPLPALDEEHDEDVTATSEDPNLWTTTVSVGGMTCGACTSAVEGAFKDITGVKSFSISLLSERAVLEHDPKLLSAEKIAETIEDVGFDASIVESQPTAPTVAIAERKVKNKRSSGLVTTTVAIEGMTCGACTSAVEQGFSDLPGLERFNISLLAERAIITHDPKRLPPDQIVEIIEDRGFDAKVLSSEAEDCLLYTSPSPRD